MNSTPTRPPNRSGHPQKPQTSSKTKKPKIKRKLSEMPNVRNFLIAFAAGLVAFSVFAFAVPGLLKSDDTPKKPDTSDNIDTPEKPGEDSDPTPVLSGKTFTAVIGGYDADGELDGLLFLKADKENRRFVLASIPTSSGFVITSTDPNTNVTLKTDVRIKDIPHISRDSERTLRIVDTVHAITGMDIDYYAFFKTDAAISLFEKTGGLYYTIPQDMVYVGNGTAENPEINLKAGGQVLNARQIIGLLRFAGYTTDERRNDARRASLQADFVSQALTQILKIDPDKLISGLSGVLADCETNFTVADFAENYDLIAKFGEYHEANALVTVDLSDPLDYSATQKLFESYK